MSVFDPKADAAALQPIVDQAVQSALTGLAQQVAPALGTAVQNALDGMTITITITKKAAS